MQEIYITKSILLINDLQKFNKKICNCFHINKCDLQYSYVEHLAKGDVRINFQNSFIKTSHKLSCKRLRIDSHF